MSSTSRVNGGSNYLHDDDDDDEDLPVIAIDHLRAVMLPGHLSNDEMHHPISGIHLGGSSGVDLLFQLDESDPLVRQFDENINANATKMSRVENVRAAPEKSSLNEKPSAASVQLSSASTTKESEDLSSSPDYPHNLINQEQAAIIESNSSPSNADDNQLQSTAPTIADSARTSESGGMHPPSISSTLPNQQSESPPSRSERSGSTSSSNSSRSDMDFSEYNDDVSFVNDDDNDDDDDCKSIDEQVLAGEDRLLITQAETESPKPRLRSAVGTNVTRFVSDVFDGDGHEESDPRRGSNLVRTDPGMSVMETAEDRNNDEISIPSPPVLISEENTNLEVNELEFDRQIEEYLLDKTDRSILAAEERELFERYERQISEAEEREKVKEESDRAQLDMDEMEMFSRYEKSISAAEERDRQKIERAQQHAAKLRKERELRSERSRGVTEEGCSVIIGLSNNEQHNVRSNGPVHENNLADHHNRQNQVEAQKKHGDVVESNTQPPQQPTFSRQSQAEIVDEETDRLRKIHQQRLQEQQQQMLRRRESKLRDENLLLAQQRQHRISRGQRRPSHDQSSLWHANEPQQVEESNSIQRKSQQPQHLNQHQRREDDINFQLQQQKRRQDYVQNRLESNLGASESNLHQGRVAIAEQSFVRSHSQDATSVDQRKLPIPQESLQGRRNEVDESNYQQLDHPNKPRESTVGGKGDARQKYVIVAGQHIASAQNNDGTGTQSQYLPHDEGGWLPSRNVSSKQRPINFQPQDVEKVVRVEKVTQVRKGPQDYGSCNGEEKSQEAIGENAQQREILSDSAKIRASGNEVTQRKEQNKQTRFPGANQRQGHCESLQGKISETTTEHQVQDEKVDKAGERRRKKKISQEKKRIEQERFRKQQLMRNKRLQQEVRHRDLLDHVSTDRKRPPSDNSETNATKKRRVEDQTIATTRERNIDEDRNEYAEEMRTRDEVPHEEEVEMSLSAQVEARQIILQGRRRPLIRQRSLCVNPILDDTNAWSNLEDVDFMYASDDAKTEDRFIDVADSAISSIRRLPTRLLLTDGYTSKLKAGGLEPGSVSAVFDFVKASKIVPRYLEADLKIEFLSDLDIRQHFFIKLLKDSTVKPLSMTIKSFNPSSWLVEFKGRASSVELARRELKTLMTSKLKMWQYTRIIRKGIIKNVTLDAKRTVGAQITVVRNESDHTHFLSIRPHSTGDSQLAIALGPEASKSDAIVVSVNGAACTTIVDFKKLADRMKENLQLQLRILLPENAAVQTWTNAITWHDALSCYRDSSRRSVAEETTPPTIDANGKDDLRSRDVHDSTEVSRDVVESQSRNDNLSRRGSLQSTAKSGNGLAAPEVAVTSRAQDQKGDTPDRLVNYENFNKKFREIAATEFKDVDMHKQSVMLAMWHRHVDRYGGLCSDDCKCFLDLPYLTETVVESRVRKKDANRMLLHDEKYPIGVTGNFAATFLPFLKDQYPNEKGSETLHRLLEMWKLHFNGEYGKKCLKSCSCKAGWATFFDKGRLGKKLGGLYRGSSGAEIAQRKECLKRIVRKKARLPLEEEASMQKRDISSSIEDSMVDSHGSKRKGDDLDKVVLPRKKGKHSQKQSTSRTGEGSVSSFAEYTLVFSCQKALGFYCMTDENETGKYCRILSVCPIGQGVDDLRIQAGTTVLSSFSDLNSEWIPIKSHIELRERFEKCRLNSLSIRLKCVNTYVTESHVAGVRKKEWTQKAQWRGKEIFGWDGGAALIDPQNAIQTHSVVGSTNKSTELTVPGQQSAVCMPIVEDAQMWKTFDTPRPLIVQKPVSLFKVAGNKAKTGAKEKKIRFAGSFERRHYVLGTLPSEFLILSDNSARDESPRLVPKAITCNDKLRRIIQSGSSDDLICYFQQGALENDKSSDNLIRIREEMKSEMSSLVERLKCAPSDRNLKDKKAELERKDVVMKVYINAFYIASHARALKQYERFRIEASRIQDLVLSSMLEVHAGSILKTTVTMVFEKGNDPELLCHLPDRPLQKFVDFGISAPPFYVNYNQTMTKERAVDVALSMVDAKGEVTVLGSIEILVSELHAKCSHTREPQEITITAGKHDYIEMACLRLCVTRVDLEPVDYIETKRKDLCMKLYNVAEWIERFNKDTSSQDDESLSFSADVRVFDNISLLHSAIFLRDFTLPEILLKLGANPLAKSKIGSALSVVKNMTDGMVTTRRNHMLDDDNDDEGKNIEDANQSNAKNDAYRESLETLLSLLVNHVRRPEVSEIEPNNL